MKKRNNRLNFLIFCAILLLIVMIPRSREKLHSVVLSLSAPFSSKLSSLGHNLRSDFSFVTNINNLKKQNDELSQKVVDLQVDSSQIDELKNENALLKKELGFVSSEVKDTLLPAKIIGRDPATFLDSIIIDQGSDNGVKKGMAVISSGTLVGQISEVTRSASTVSLITGKDSIVQAMLQNSRAKGILRGGISGLYIDNIVRDTEYSEGENVVTSGLGGDIKSGILIGKAGKLESASSGIYKTIDVEPIVSISDLELVFIQK